MFGKDPQFECYATAVGNLGLVWVMWQTQQSTFDMHCVIRNKIVILCQWKLFVGWFLTGNH